MLSVCAAQSENTALIWASRRGFVDVCVALVDFGGANPNTISRVRLKQAAAMHYYSCYSSVSLSPSLSFSLSLSLSLSLSATHLRAHSLTVTCLLATLQHGYTALIWASMESHAQVSVVLLDRGANPNTADDVRVGLAWPVDWLTDWLAGWLTS